MKNLILLLMVIGFAIPGFAKNMADEESVEEAYQENEDGVSQYVGKCTAHEDHANVYFKETETVIAYVDSWDFEKMTVAEIRKVYRKLPYQLWDRLLDTGSLGHGRDRKKNLTLESEVREYLLGVDDITVTKIKHKMLPGWEIFVFNIGVGGGNGGYTTLGRIPGSPDQAPKYILLSETFDNDLLYCSSKVWLK